MEQWIYARLYESAMEIMEKANEEFFQYKDIEEFNEDDMCDVCCALNKTAFAIGRVIRNIEETIQKGDRNAMYFGITNMKTKIFSGCDEDEIEKRLNDFLSQHDSDIIDIKMSSTEHSFDFVVIYKGGK